MIITTIISKTKGQAVNQIPIIMILRTVAHIEEIIVDQKVENPIKIKKKNHIILDHLEIMKIRNHHLQNNKSKQEAIIKINIREIIKIITIEVKQIITQEVIKITK